MSSAEDSCWMKRWVTNTWWNMDWSDCSAMAVSEEKFWKSPRETTLVGSVWDDVGGDGWVEKLNLRVVDMLLTLNWSLMHIKMKSIQHVKQNTCNLWHLPKGRFTWSFDQMAAVVVFWCVCAVVHERFTPCLLQNKVVSCSMRLNIICQCFRTFFYKMVGPSTYPLMSLNQWAL